MPRVNWKKYEHFFIVEIERIIVTVLKIIVIIVTETLIGNVVNENLIWEIIHLPRRKIQIYIVNIIVYAKLKLKQ